MARIFDVILAKGGALLHGYRNRHCERLAALLRGSKTLRHCEEAFMPTRQSSINIFLY
ncbi:MULTISPECIES: hypothetical protein [unclassified Rickettsia]|uniref:hypothetical protein n=1 Tax=unclassified Rickettsia TaxID=114295 RepID=UPI0031330097